MLIPQAMEIGGRYNWRGQPERLIYVGHNWSGNGYWHQFEKVGEPGVVWCEVLSPDLRMFEETRDAPGVAPAASEDAEAIRRALSSSIQRHGAGQVAAALVAAGANDDLQTLAEYASGVAVTSQPQEKKHG